ncbi:MAG: hypothetical protein ACTSU2_10920 [Promethearchaeota archaeon]
MMFIISFKIMEIGIIGGFIAPMILLILMAKGIGLKETYKSEIGETESVHKGEEKDEKKAGIKERSKENRANYGVFISIYVLNVILNMNFLFSFYRTSDPSYFLYFEIYFIIIIGIWAIVLVSSILYRLLGHPEKMQKYIKRAKAKNKAHPKWEDFKRKIAHMLFYGLMWVGVIYASIWFLERYPDYINEYVIKIWGFDLNNPGKYFFSILFLRDYRINLYVNVGQFFSIILFTAASYISLLLDLARNFKGLYFPSNRFLIYLLREKEENAPASYVYFFQSILFAALILPPLPLLAVIGVACIGDTFASQFGMRFGKKKISFNPKKSWVGTISGTIASFIMSLIVVGPLWASIAALIFFITDIITEKPLKISDNLITPISITLIYLILNLAGVPYIFPSYLNLL